MARSKRTSKTIIKTERRAAGIASINPDLDLGNGITLKAYQADIKQARECETEYNKMLASLDRFYNEMVADDRQLAKKSSRILQAIAVVYGRNSSEYEMAGGTRQSERRRANHDDESATS